jgi:hypothetical protein
MKRLQRVFGLRIAVITAIALLLAQLGALTHAYSHVPQSSAAAVHQPISASHDACGDCLSFAPLLAAGGAPESPHFVGPSGHPSLAPCAEERSAPESYSCFAFRSRAPPVAT